MAKLARHPWLLPEGIQELLPPYALHCEKIRRKLLDTYHSFGYELVQMPLLEQWDALLVGCGRDLEQETFKLIDPATGEWLGLPADITPQISRLDARDTEATGIARYCYCSPVLRTRLHANTSCRNLHQLGLELYGHPGIESDQEVLSLLIESLQLSGIKNPCIDLGHVGIIQNLLTACHFREEEENTLLDCLARKMEGEMKSLLAQKSIPSTIKTLLLTLPSALGDASMLAKIKPQFDNAASPPPMRKAFQDLHIIALYLEKHHPKTQVFFDLSELRGYHYHTGLVFAAYVPGGGHAIAYGGRYDNIGEAFGRKRPATGFSINLTALLEHLPSSPIPMGILALYSPRPDFLQALQALRQKGERVVTIYNNNNTEETDFTQTHCDRELLWQNGEWKVVPSSNLM